LPKQLNLEKIPEESKAKRLVTKFRQYFGLGVRIILIGVYDFVVIGAVCFLVFMLFFLFGHALIYLFSLSWSEIIIIEAALTGIIIAIRARFFCKNMREKGKKLNWHMFPCVFGIHQMEPQGTHWEEIGYDTHLIRTLRCPHCSIEDYEASYQSY
jgi:hypothetical protein